MPSLMPCQQITISPKNVLQTQIKINITTKPTLSQTQSFQAIETKADKLIAQKTKTRRVNKAKVKANSFPKIERNDESTSDNMSETTTITSSSYSQNSSCYTTSSSVELLGHDEKRSASSSSSEQVSDGKTSNRNKPMLRIVQEMSEKRVVVSTVHVNREKVRQWKQQGTKEPPSNPKKLNHSKGQKQRKQCRVIHDNFRNEILDQNREGGQCRNSECNRSMESDKDFVNDESETTSNDVFDETEGDEDVTLPIVDDDCIATGKLESNSAKKSNRMGGKLMAKRMLRQSTDGRFQSDPKPMAPAKPPRTFGSGFEASEDLKLPPKSKQQKLRRLSFARDEGYLENVNKKANMKIGWALQEEDGIGPVNNTFDVGWRNVTENEPKIRDSNQEMIKAEFIRRKDLSVGEYDIESKPALRSIYTQAPQPSCPPLDDITPQNTPKKLGWVSQDIPPQIIPQHIVNMLYLDKRQEAKLMTSSQLKAQPQIASPPRPPPIESIDDVDGPHQSSRQMERFCSETVFSTPFKDSRSNPNPPMPIFESIPHSLELSSEIDNDDLCMNCHCPKSRSSNPKPTFGQKAFRRTKTLLVAGKNILNRSSTSSKNLNETIRNTGRDELPFSDNDDGDLNTTPSKVDTTECLNKMPASHGKPTFKQLDLAPNNTAVSSEVTVESPKRMYEMFLASVKRSPQKLATTPKSQQNDFDFQRTIRSPVQKRSNQRTEGTGKTSGFLLSPRRLFGKTSTRRHSLSVEPNSGTYKSYMDQDDDGEFFLLKYK